MSTLRRLLAGIVICCSVLAGCGNDVSNYIPRRPEQPVRAMTMVEARREAIALELGLQDLLAREFGLTVWTPPPADGRAQVDELSDGCPGLTAREEWHVATGGPLVGEEWDRAVDRFAEVLAPLGFGEPLAIRIEPDERHVVFIHEVTGMRIEFFTLKATGLYVETGCVETDNRWNEWPAGTEGVPVELRTSGRAPAGDIAEIWPEEYVPSSMPTTIMTDLKDDDT